MRVGSAWTLAISVVALGAAAWVALGRGGGDSPDPGARVESVPADGAPALHANSEKTRARGARVKLRSGRAVVQGRVVDEHEAPQAGIRVVASSTDDASAPNDVDVPADPPESSRVEQTSGDDGTFEFRELDERTEIRIDARPLPPRVGSQWEGSPLSAMASTTQRVTLRVGAGSAVSGVVVDGKGSPVVGARITVDNGSSGSWGSSDESGSVDPVRTGADGTFLLPAVANGQHVVSAAVAGGLAWTDVPFVAPRRGPLRIVIGSSPGASVSGRVRTASGAPIPGARVVLESTSPSERGSLRAELSSATDGTFRVDGLSVGTLHFVFADAPGYADFSRSEERLLLVANATLRLDVVLQPTTRLEGFVHDRDGRGIPDVELSVKTDQLSRRTDREGRVVLTGVRVGRIALDVAATGWRPPTPGIGVDVMPGPAATLVDVVLERRPARRGIVVDETGRPVPQAVVRPATLSRPHSWVSTCVAFDRGESWGFTPCDSSEMTLTETDGRFALDIEGPDAPIEAVKGKLVSEEVRAPGADGEWRVTLRRGAEVRGRVLDPTGAPAVAVRVAVGFSGLGATTDANGAFQVGALPAGRTYVFVPDVSVCMFGGPGERLDTFEEPAAVDLDWGATAEVTLRLKEVREFGPITVVAGVLRDTYGAPVSHDLRLYRGASLLGGASSDAAGGFEFGDVLPGLVDLCVKDDHDRVLAEGVSAGDRGLALVLPALPSRVLEGEVFAPDGSHVVSASVRVEAATPSDPWLVDGRFRTDVGPDARPLRVSVWNAVDARGIPLLTEPWSAGVSPDAGRIVVRLTDGRAIVGRAIDEAGAPVVGARVNAHQGNDPDAPRTEAVITDEHGEFRILGAPRGEAIVDAWSEEREVEFDGVRVGSAVDHVTLRGRKGASVSGVVLGPDGVGVAGASITWEDDSTRKETESESGGAFHLVGLGRDARGTIKVASDSHDDWRFDVVRDVAAGRNDVVLRFQTGEYASGEIVTADGVPIRTGNIVVVDASGAWAGSTTLFGVRDRFRLGPLAKGTYRVLYSRSRWFEGDETSSEAVSPATISIPSSGVRLVVAGRAGLRGQVVGGEVGMFRVDAIHERTDEETGGTDSAWTAPDGSFSLQRLKTTDTLTLFVHREGDPRFALVEGAHAGSTVEVRLVPGRTISGSLSRLPPGGAPGIRVVAKDRGVEVSGPVAVDGSFRLAGLPPGKYRIAVEGADAAAYAEPEVEAGSSAVLVGAPPK